MGSSAWPRRIAERSANGKGNEPVARLPLPGRLRGVIAAVRLQGQNARLKEWL